MTLKKPSHGTMFSLVSYHLFVIDYHELLIQFNFRIARFIPFHSIEKVCSIVAFRRCSGTLYARNSSDQTSPAAVVGFS